MSGEEIKGCYLAIAHYHATVGSATTHLRAIRGYPYDVFAIVHGCMGYYLTHQHYALSTETGSYHFSVKAHLIHLP